jgi:phage terminase Nu1 subunit (DNA packaging protein)
MTQNQLPETIDGRALAKLTGYTWRWIQEMAERGIVKKTGRGEFNFAGSIQGIIGSLKQKEPLESERFKKAQANREERKDRMESGEDVKLESVKKDWGDITITFRERVLRIPNNIQSKCGLTDIQLKALQLEISDGLRELQKKLLYEADEIENKEVK